VICGTAGVAVAAEGAATATAVPHASAADVAAASTRPVRIVVTFM
jgi:hypothetical protein